MRQNLGNMKIDYDFALTTYCQAKCRSCARTDQDTGETASWLKPTHMDFEIYKRIISSSKYLKERNGYVQFCGELGDPMMHPQIDEFVDFTLQYANKVHINTNGGLRQPKWYEYLATTYKNKIRIKFGIDGTDHETNWMYREGVNWQRAMDNMTTYINSDGSGEWHFIVFEWNWHQIPIAKKMADKIDCGVFFKFNAREFGKISDENKKQAYKLIEELDGEIVP